MSFKNRALTDPDQPTNERLAFSIADSMESAVETAGVIYGLFEP